MADRRLAWQRSRWAILLATNLGLLSTCGWILGSDNGEGISGIVSWIFFALSMTCVLILLLGFLGGRNVDKN